MSRLESLVFLWLRRVYGGKLQNLSLLKVSNQVVMLFYLPGLALRDIETCFVTCRKSFCVAGAILWRRFQTMSSSFSGSHSTSLHTLHSTLRTLHSRLHTRVVLCGSLVWSHWKTLPMVEWQSGRQRGPLLDI